MNPSATVLGLLLFLTLPFAQSAPVIEDAKDDLIADTPAGPQTVPAVNPHLDLISLDVEENDAQLTFALTRAGSPGAPIDGGYYKVGFRFSDTEYRITADQGPSLLQVGATPRAGLERRPAGSENWVGVASGPLAFEERVLRATFDKQVITDGVAMPLARGSQLVDFWATSLDYNSNIAILGPVPPIGTAAKFHDIMPDTGPSGEFVLRLGAEPSQELRLTSLRPIRSSNGEQTTIVYDVTVTNPRDLALEVSFSTSDAPAGWDVTYLHPAVKLAPGEQKSVPVVVAIPFAHEHGATYSFNATAHDIETGGLLSQLVLGVHYMDVPQPAGHHDTVHFHVDTAPGQGTKPALGSEEAGRNAFMSTLAEDEEDRGLAAAPDKFSSEFPLRQYGSLQPTSFTWCVDLDSSLRLGLDFDKERQGLWKVALSSGVATTGTLTGRLLATATAGDAFDESIRCSDKPALALASIEPAAVSLAGQGAVQSMELPVSSLLDELTFVHGRQLVWEATITIETDPLTPYQADYPLIKSGSNIRLPLNEYHESPPIIVNNAAQLILSSPPRMLRNPGSYAVFNLTLGQTDADFDVSLLGTNKGWASLTRARLGNGDSVFVIVHVPEDATDGMLADLIVKAVGNGQLALAHVVVEVDSAVEHADDEAYAESVQRARKAPFVEPALLALGLVLLALARRSHRGPSG